MTEVESGATTDTRDATEAEPIDGSSDEASQDVLTKSVGQRLTRENHDAQPPRWKRWLGKG
jgi:hypothetical protein